VELTLEPMVYWQPRWSVQLLAPTELQLRADPVQLPEAFGASGVEVLALQLKQSAPTQMWR